MMVDLLSTLELLKFGTGNEYQVLAGSNKLQLAVAADRSIELNHANTVYLRTSDTGVLHNWWFDCFWYFYFWKCY